MEEAQSRQVKALLDLYKQQMEQFRQTQQIEWKANFGVWTLLVGAIFILTKESPLIHIPLGDAVVAVLVVALVHVLWLLKIHHSEACDKQLWTRYRAEALVIIRGKEVLHEHEKPWRWSHGGEIVWLSLEAMLTVLLSIFFLAVLPK